MKIPIEERASVAGRPFVSAEAMAMAMLIAVAAALVPAVPASAQTIVVPDDGTTLEQIVVFGRHNVRSPTAPLSKLAEVAVDPFPDFGVQAGYLTPRGQQAATRLGSYFRAYLLHERLLTGNPRADLARAYFRANSIQRSNVTASRFGTGLIPGAEIPVHSFPLGQADPVFDPLGTGVATVDPARAVREVRGAFGSGDVLGAAYGAERALIRSVLLDYPPGTEPPPPPPAGKVDAAAAPVALAVNTAQPVATGGVIDLGGLALTKEAADPFVMEYANGLPLEQVGWGRLTPEALSQQTRIVNLGFEINMRSPYLARVQSSNAASHVLRSMEQAMAGADLPGAFGNARSKVVVVVSSDDFVAGLAGLLGLHWALPGYQPDFCAPGGALVFELRSRRPREYLVRVFYTAQTFDQLRNLTSLTLDSPPATMQLLVPAAGRSGESLDVEFGLFEKFVRKAIDKKSVEDPLKEIQPGVLTDVPLS